MGDNDITVISAALMEEYEFSHIGGNGFSGTSPARVRWQVSVQHLDGGLHRERRAARRRQHADRRVGSLNAIVVFELTMLGAILTTVVTLIIQAGLGRKMPKLC